MFRAQAKLLHWKDLYVAFARAQDKLKKAQGDHEDPLVVDSLRAEVDRLEADSEAALLEVQDQVAKIKAERGSGGAPRV